MKNVFQRVSSYWVKYSEYEYRQSGDGVLYITPTPAAKPSVYDPLKEAETMVVDALNVGRLAMKRNVGDKLKQTVMSFVTKYGLLGFMTALPTTLQFMDYDAVYLPKNHFLREETMSSHDYISLYFPFAKPDFYKDSATARWNVAVYRNQPESGVLQFRL